MIIIQQSNSTGQMVDLHGVIAAVLAAKRSMVFSSNSAQQITRLYHRNLRLSQFAGQFDNRRPQGLFLLLQIIFNDTAENYGDNSPPLFSSLFSNSLTNSVDRMEPLLHQCLLPQPDFHSAFHRKAARHRAIWHFNEPGYYREGAFGMRCENLVAVALTSPAKLNVMHSAI